MEYVELAAGIWMLAVTSFQSTQGELTVEAIALAPHIDHAILFSGDRDFCALVTHLQAQGTCVSVASSLKTSPAFIADELRRQADAFIELDDLRDIIGRAPRTAVAAA